MPGTDRTQLGPLVTLTTDFGVDSHYTAIMRGVLLSICPQVRLVDISHRAPPQDIRYAAWILEEVVWSFPVGAIHLIVVDPGVGTNRACLALEVEGHIFVAPDNGVLSRVLARRKPRWSVRLENPLYRGLTVSSTFHGRDIMAPAAAHLACGVLPGDFGPPQEPTATLAWPEPRREDNRIVGEVLVVDPFGNLITNLPCGEIPPPAEIVRIECGDTQIPYFVQTYGDASPRQLVALFGSHNHLEIAQVEGNAAESLQAHAGAPVVVHLREVSAR